MDTLSYGEFSEAFQAGWTSGSCRSTARSR